MLDALSPEAIHALHLMLRYNAYEQAAASPDAYSRPLHTWLIEEVSAEMQRRAGEKVAPAVLPTLDSAERRRAAMFAAALAMSFSMMATGQALALVRSPDTKAKFAALAAEIEGPITQLAEALAEPTNGRVH